MFQIVVGVFVVGYLCIILENYTKLNKTAIALLTGMICWAVFALGGDTAKTHEAISHHITGIAEILFFLLGAMTIVELIDAHKGFSIITDRINTKNARTLLWIVGGIAFLLAAVIDILAAAIVVVTMLRKLVKDEKQKKLLAGFTVIAVNAGGAWSPIGAVTTTMLWIGGQVSASGVVQSLFLPSLVCLAVATLVFYPKMKGEIELLPNTEAGEKSDGKVTMFVVGMLGLLFVPIFKTATHLPPYVGMMLSLSVVWIVSEIIHSDKDEEDKKPYSVGYALSKIEVSTILFFLGILLAVGALESLGMLKELSVSMSNTIRNLDVIVVLIGFASSIIDNVPLVAATMGMYDMQTYPLDDSLWQFLAYCAGVGGSILIIGSAAGVAVMEKEKIDFVWYIKNISLAATIGYLAGCAVYLLL